MNAEHQQYYLRAEPTAEGRRVLRAHQKRLAEVFESLRLNPRLTKADDFHWTTVFLGSPQRWTRALRAVGTDLALTSDDLLALTLPKSVLTHFGSVQTNPVGYDVFYTGATNAVFVLRLHDAAAAPAEAVLINLRVELQKWETDGRLPGGMAARLFRHPWFPLRRYGRGGRPFDPAQGKPHITLARGRVSRERQRDVLRSIRATRLATREPIAFRHTDIRIARSPAIVSVHA